MQVKVNTLHRQNYRRYMYKRYKAPLTDKNIIIREFDNAFIPINEANTDYQAYLKWVAEGNVAEEWSTE